MFNFKGGVGKTTGTFTLGKELAARGHKVLMIDADPQCNLTQMAIHSQNESTIDQFYKKNPAKNIYAALTPIFNCDEAFRFGLSQNKFVLEAYYQIKDNLHILAGHPKFACYDSMLRMNCPDLDGLFRQWFHDMAVCYDFKYIIIDMNSAIMMINKLLVMSADYLIVPCCDDIFSYMALKMLSENLIQWNLWIHEKKREFGQPRFGTLPFSPIFMGLLPMPMSDTKKIEDYAMTSLIPALARYGMAFDPSFYDKNLILTDRVDYVIKFEEGKPMNDIMILQTSWHWVIEHNLVYELARTPTEDIPETVKKISTETDGLPSLSGHFTF